MTTIPPLVSAETTSEFTAKKDNVVTVADSNITLTGEQTINGVACVESDRILLTGQTDASENGIWLVGSGVYGAWSRPTDFSAGGEAAGTWTHITQGTDYDESVWFCVTNRPCVIDTDDQEWRNVNEDPVSGFDISALTEDSTNASGDYLAKHDGTGMEKIKRNDFLLDGINTLVDGATVTVDLSNPENIYHVELGGNRTLALTNASVGKRFSLLIEQDGTGSRTVTWWDTINWPGGSAPTLTTTASRADFFEFVCTGVNTYANVTQTQDLTTNTGSAVDISGNIVAVWQMEETTGTRSSEVGSYDLLASTSSPSNSTGKDGNAASFASASTQYLRIAADSGSVFNFEDSDFSITMWVKFTAGGSSDPYLLNTPNYEYSVYLDTATSKMRFGVFGISLSANAVSTASISDATWYHVACVHDSVNDLVKISINGATFDTTALSGGVRTFASGYMYVGSASNTGTNYHNGDIDELVIRNKALSQAEVTDLYNSGTGKFYPFT